MTGKPLAGLGVVVTRPREQATELVNAIERAGGRVIRFPVMDIVGRNLVSVERAFSAQPRPDLVIFVSQNAVRFGHTLLQGGNYEIIAIGPATAAALESCGFAGAIVPDGGFDSERLLDHPSLNKVAGKSVTIIRGTRGRELLGETLRTRGASVDYVAVYERKLHAPDKEELSALERACRDDGIDCVIVMSVESLENYLQLLPDACHRSLHRTLLVAPSKRVIQTAQDLIPGVPTALAPGPRAADMVHTLTAIKQSGQN